MKKLIALLLVAVMCLSLVACGSEETSNTNKNSGTLDEQTGSESTASPYANHPLLVHLYGEWETITEGNSFTAFTIYENGSCVVDGIEATWEIDSEYTSEENLCIAVFNGTDYLGGVMVWGSNLGVGGIAADHSFSSNSYQKTGVNENSQLDNSSKFTDETIAPYGVGSSAYADHSCLPFIYGTWVFERSNAPWEYTGYKTLSIYEDGTCEVDGTSGNWKIEDEHSNKSTLCIGIYCDGELICGAYFGADSVGVYLLATDATMAPTQTTFSNSQLADRNIVSIHTAEELFSTVYDSQKTYILENDIDLANYSSTISELNGIFEGNGKTIRNASAPLVLNNNGTIQNLTMENCQITAAEDAAALVVNNSGTVSNCKVSGTVNATAENIYAGGIVSRNEGTIEHCANYAEITAVSYAVNELGNVIHGTFACAGGISATNNWGTISQCWNEGTISAEDADYLSSCGGIVALNTHGNIENCYNTGTVIKPEGRGDSGGIAGNSEANGRIVNCYNVGTANSGICGDNRDYIIDCYYLSSASENGSGSGLNPEGERFFAFSQDELTNQDTFSAFDFTSIWKMSENGPVLQ